MKPLVLNTSYAESFMLTCPSKAMMTIDCPGCGLQRSIWAFLHADVKASWEIYPPTIFIILTIAILALHLIVNFKHGATIIKFSYLFTAIAILTNYIYKIINLQLI